MRWRQLRLRGAAHLISRLRRQLPLIGEAFGGRNLKPPLSGEVARRSRDGEVAANLIQPLSQPSAASSPARGAFFSLRRANPSGAPRQLPLTRGALGACKTTTNQCKKVQTSKSGLHLLFVANILRQLAANLQQPLRRFAPAPLKGKPFRCGGQVRLWPSVRRRA